MTTSPGPARQSVPHLELRIRFKHPLDSNQESDFLCHQLAPLLMRAGEPKAFGKFSYAIIGPLSLATVNFPTYELEMDEGRIRRHFEPLLSCPDVQTVSVGPYDFRPLDHYGGMSGLMLSDLCHDFQCRALVTASTENRTLGKVEALHYAVLTVAVFLDSLQLSSGEKHKIFEEEIDRMATANTIRPGFKSWDSSRKKIGAILDPLEAVMSGDKIHWEAARDFLNPPEIQSLEGMAHAIKAWVPQHYGPMRSVVQENWPQWVVFYFLHQFWLRAVCDNTLESVATGWLLDHLQSV